jgi:hypothetical protein
MSIYTGQSSGRLQMLRPMVLAAASLHTDLGMQRNRLLQNL